MADTQWPRYQVFEQAKAGRPHQNAGSVHAPDAEMALLNARDVFVRRPEVNSLWVVPATAIFAKTAEELETFQWPPLEEINRPSETYYVFQKQHHAGTHVEVGTVEATNSLQALKLAIDTFSGKKPPIVWWVFPAQLVAKSSDEDIASMFEPARDKTFRNQSEYHTVARMREIKQAQEEGSEE